jgi:hypothetical protein
MRIKSMEKFGFSKSAIRAYVSMSWAWVPVTAERSRVPLRWQLATVILGSVYSHILAVFFSPNEVFGLWLTTVAGDSPLDMLLDPYW